MYLPRIILCPEPSCADPAHIVLWYVGSVGSEGTWFQRVLVKLLVWNIRRNIARVQSTRDPSITRDVLLDTPLDGHSTVTRRSLDDIRSSDRDHSTRYHSWGDAVELSTTLFGHLVSNFQTVHRPPYALRS